MLALAVSALMVFAAVVALLTITDTLMQARVAYGRLLAERAALEAELAVHLAAAAEMRLRPARQMRAAMPPRRPAQRPLVMQPRACAAA